MSLSIFSFVGALLFTVQAHADPAQACKPSYQVSYKACKATDKTVGYKTLNPTVRVTTGACDPDEAVLCEGYSKAAVIKGIPDVRPEDVRVKKAFHKDTIGKFCGDGGLKVKAKVDVYCEFEFQAPTKELVADESCPVEAIKEDSKCFEGNEKINLSPEAVIACLDSKPQTEAEFMIKAACLADTYNAQLAFRLAADLSPEIYGRVQVQIKALKDGAKVPASVKKFISSEINF